MDIHTPNTALLHLIILIAVPFITQLKDGTPWRVMLSAAIACGVVVVLWWPTYAFFWHYDFFSPPDIPEGVYLNVYLSPYDTLYLYPAVVASGVLALLSWWRGAREGGRARAAMAAFWMVHASYLTLGMQNAIKVKLVPEASYAARGWMIEVVSEIAGVAEMLSLPAFAVCFVASVWRPAAKSG